MVNTQGIGPAGGSPGGVSAPGSIETRAAAIVDANRIGGKLDAAGIAQALRDAQASDPAGTLASAGGRQLSPVQRGEVARLAEPTPPAESGAGPSSSRLGLDLTQMGLDIVGIFEPTPFADGSNVIISAGRALGALVSGEFGDAGGHAISGVISAAGIFAGLGDTAKIAKVGKWAETVSDAVGAVAKNPALRATLEPGLRKVYEAVSRIPEGALSKLPTAAREAIERMKTQLDHFFGAGVRQAPIAERVAQARQSGNLATLVAETRHGPGGVGELVTGGLKFDEVKALESTGALTVAEAKTLDAGITAREVARLRGAGAGIPRDITVDARQLQAKFKHANDFGVQGNFNAANRTAFGDVVKAHVDNPATVPIRGTYRGNPVTHFLDPSSGRNVIRDANGDFLSAWKLSEGQLKNVLTHATLGGG